MGPARVFKSGIRLRDLPAKRPRVRRAADRDRYGERENAMLRKLLMVAVLALGTLGAAASVAPAQAARHRGGGWHHGWHHGWHAGWGWGRPGWAWHRRYAWGPGWGWWAGWPGGWVWVPGYGWVWR
jgi:hypothetical protein